MKKKFLTFLMILLVVCMTAVFLVGCEEKENSDIGADSQIQAIYKLYLSNATENSETPLTYEEWLNSIKGAKGDKGDTPTIEIIDGYWHVDGENTGVKAQGEQGAEIDTVEFDEQGRLVITLTDGTTLDPIEIPDLHSYGEWEIAFGDSNSTCEEKTFFRVCSKCNKIEFKQGSYNDHDWETERVESTCQAQGYDHKTCVLCGKEEKVNYQPKSSHRWQTTYTTDNTYHWIKCNDCTATKEEDEHTTDDSGYCTVCDSAVGATVGVVYDISSDGTYAEVIGYEGSAKRIIIAEEYNSKPVKSIYDSAFAGSSITSITIPDSVTSIDRSAFSNCYSLQSVAIGNGVTSIGRYAFYGCSSLTKVNYTRTIDQWAQILFYNDSANPLYEAGNLYINNVLVTEVNLTTATEISDYAFCGCTSLQSVTIPDSVTSIGNGAFDGCDSSLYTTENSLKYVKANNNPYYMLIGTTIDMSTYTINAQTKHISSYAFDGNSRLASITIPDSVTSIDRFAFSNCGSLKDVNIGSNVTSIGECAFYNCSPLQSITIPDSVTSIGYGAFLECSCLQSVTIGSGVTSIGEYAFASERSSLQSVTIGSGVTSIGYGAFFDCSSLTKVNYTGTIDQWAQILFYNDSANPLYEAGNLYINNVLVTEVNLTTATQISDYAFYCCGLLQSVTIGDSVTSIGNGAFDGCGSLEDVNIGSNVTSIGECAFYNCSPLQSITIPDSVTSIGRYAFANCYSLQSITFGDATNWYRTESAENWKNKTGGTAFELTNPSFNWFIGDEGLYYCYKK